MNNNNNNNNQISVAPYGRNFRGATNKQTPSFLIHKVKRTKGLPSYYNVLLYNDAVLMDNWTYVCR